MTTTSTAILVLGMDRSGTSALTGLCQMLGVHLGDRLIGPRPANPKGYFEDKTCVDINQELLRNLKHPRFSAAPLPHGWQETLPAKYSALRATGVIRRLQRAQPFALKDPRLCLTAPLWLEEIKRNSRSIKIIHCVRNPVEVAASLQKRDGRDPTGSALVWISHNLAAYRVVCKFDHLICDHKDTLLAPVNVAARIKFWLFNMNLSEEEELGVKRFIEPELWTNRVPAAPTDPVQRAASGFYEALTSRDPHRVEEYIANGALAIFDRLSKHAATAIQRAAGHAGASRS